ncbi:MAG TPA: hypothetical protein PLB52_01440 [Candidatus Moranbacteria bacterium]|nr:hypothetical protein [Candidatus Moranbacteria bacterium]
MKITLFKKWNLAIKIVPILIGIFILKLIFHKFGFEYISLNALFTSLIAATTFLIGFLITGVISDYKESEKIPGDMAAGLESIHDEIYILDKNKGNESTKKYLNFYKAFLNSIIDWFYRKEKTKNILVKLHQMDDYFSELESIIQPNFLARMKNEQGNIRKMIIRVDNIRDLSFIQSAYAIVESLAFFVITGLLILKVEPFYEALFFTMLVSFLMVYMIFLIKDLDNPFDYSKNGENGTEVSIKPIYDLIERVKDNK